MKPRTGPVLLCWEGGSGLGHVTRLRRIASALGQHGLATVAAVFDPSATASLASCVERVMQAPTARGGNFSPRLKLSPEPRDACNTTFSLWEMGFWDQDTIANNLRDSSAILAQVKPCAVVGDLAPYAMLAAGGRLPTFAVGHGYFVPALMDGYFAPDDQPPSDEDKQAQDIFFGIIRKAFRQIQMSPPACSASAIQSDTPCPATLPDLDPKFKLRLDALVPPEIDDRGVQLSNFAGDEVLAYFGDNPDGYAGFIAALAATGLKTIIYVPRGRELSLALPGFISIRNAPFTIHEVVGRARLLVHHGGVGITHFGALAGVPQIVSYRGHERWRNTQAIYGKGAGWGAPADTGPRGAFREYVAAFAAPGPHREAAQDWAREARIWAAERRGQDVIVERILKALTLL